MTVEEGEGEKVTVLTVGDRERGGERESVDGGREMGERERVLTVEERGKKGRES